MFRAGTKSVYSDTSSLRVPNQTLWQKCCVIVSLILVALLLVLLSCLIDLRAKHGLEAKYETMSAKLSRKYARLNGQVSLCDFSDGDQPPPYSSSSFNAQAGQDHFVLQHMALRCGEGVFVEFGARNGRVEHPHPPRIATRP